MKAEVTLNDPQSEIACQNRSTIFINNKKLDVFEAVYSFAGETPDERGSIIQLIDWSPNSETILADMLTYHYNSEGWDHHLVLYSLDSGNLVQESMNLLFSKQLAKTCGVEALFLGLMPGGRVAVDVIPIDQEEEGPSCVTKESFWSIDPKNLKLIPLPKKPHIKSNGRFEGKVVFQSDQ